MSGPLPKRASERQRRNKRPEIGLVPTGRKDIQVPDPPEGLLKATNEQWDTFWRSDVANACDLDTDVFSLRRLYTLYDERERAYQGFRKQRIVTGSQGQPVLNPLGKQMQSYDLEIRNLEDRFGLNPAARLRLGMQFSEAKRTLDSLNDSLDDVQDADPRLEAV